MKPKHIKKETAKRLREGFHTDLIDLIEEAIDLYGEKDFERGYQSFFGDASIHADRLADHIVQKITLKGKSLPYAAITPLAKIIEDYFNSLKTE